MRSAHLVFVVALIVAGSAPVYGAGPGSVSGQVRDSSGLPQIGAEVQLLRPDLSVIASVTTNATGHFRIPSVAPGRYAIKAMGMSFLPALREDVRVRTGTVVNLTLNTLYEVMQWLPSEARAADTQQDDWKWTLRSAANRPLLRWLEDGPLVVVSDGAGSNPKLKARLMATGQQGSFGESGERLGFTMEETPNDSRELLAQVDFDPGTDAGLESMLGFRQDLGFAGSVQSLAAIAVHPEIDAAGNEGLEEAAMQSSETIELGDEFSGEVGSTQVLARFGEISAADQVSPGVRFAALPYANVAWHGNDSTIHYGMSTAVAANADAVNGQTLLPALSMKNGQLAIEHGLHQELGWERRTDKSAIAVMVYADRLVNPAMEASYRPMSNISGDPALAPQLLFDSASGLVRTAGPSYSSAGITAMAERRLPGNNHIRVSYASGDALVMSPAAQPALAQLISSTHARRAQTYSISLSGTIEGSGTHWRATYRWQPEETVTPVAAFAQNSESPYLGLQLRQPMGHRREGANGIEALVSLRNLLAQGYQPYVLSDGSVLVFAQAERGVSGGLAFTF